MKIKKQLVRMIALRRVVRMGFHFKHKETMYIIDLVNVVVYSLIMASVLLALNFI